MKMVRYLITEVFGKHSRLLSFSLNRFYCSFKVFLESGCLPGNTIIRKEILDFGDEGFLLSNVLSPKECKHYIAEGERIGFQKIIGVQDHHRSCKRICFDSPELSDMLWQRIRPWLSSITIHGDPNLQHIHGKLSLMQGTWHPFHLNAMFRLCRYLPGGHFAPHFDGPYVQDQNVRSLQTFMLYLNGDFEGGSTNFVDKKQTLNKDEDGKYCALEKYILCCIKPEPGLALIFNHRRLHEGQKLKSGVKYILRSDVIFRRMTPVTETAAV